jgi:hypothetical protein
MYACREFLFIGGFFNVLSDVQGDPQLTHAFAISLHQTPWGTVPSHRNSYIPPPHPIPPPPPPSPPPPKSNKTNYKEKKTMSPQFMPHIFGISLCQKWWGTQGSHRNSCTLLLHNPPSPHPKRYGPICVFGFHTFFVVRMYLIQLTNFPTCSPTCLGWSSYPTYKGRIPT